LKQKEIIDQINQLLRDKYVFPETAEKLANHLEERWAAGHYQQVSSQSLFAETLTTDLQSISSDQHLMVVYDPQRILGIKELPVPAQARIEQDRRQNFGFRKVERLKGNIGYLDLRRFANPDTAGKTAAAAMRFLAESDAIIIDLRHNGGGSPGMVQLLCSYFFEGDRPIHLNSIYSRPTDTTWQYWTLPFVPGVRLPEIDLYILTSGHTFSGAEEFAYNMSALKRGTIIGEKTAGGANPMGIEIIDDDFYITVPHGTPTNPITGDNWEAKGVQPHLKVDQQRALETAHLKALETLITRYPDSPELAWLLDEVRSEYQPLMLTGEKLKKYPEKYGDHEILLKDEELYFRRRFVHYRMRPLTENIFWLEGPEMLRPYRIKIDDHKLTALYPDGQREMLGKKGS
jgi:retinol-binding protein 3